MGDFGGKRTHDSDENEAARTLAKLCTNFGAGFAAGAVTTLVLNPYDQALYLSVVHNRSFLRWNNFEHPYKGVGQTLVQRTLSTGLYFPLEELYSEYCFKETSSSESLRHSLAGQAAGLTNGLLLNPLACVKYQLWGHADHERSILRHACSMMRRAGPSSFFRGAPATCARDAIFGGVFAGTRSLGNSWKEQHSDTPQSFMIDMSAAALATIVSSPFNFVRNIQFNASMKMDAPNTLIVMRSLKDDLDAHDTTIRKAKHIARRFRLGWGTMRVAVGMALSAQLYKLIKEIDMTTLSEDV